MRLDSARERIKRADEKLQHMNREIAEFLASVPALLWM